jgi:hypothetical protein
MSYNNITPVKLGQAAIGTSASTLYTVPAATRTYVKDIDVVNTGTASITFDVYLVGSGGSVSTATALIYQQPLGPKQIFSWNGTQILNAGDTIQVLASATGLTINASGGEGT